MVDTAWAASTGRAPSRIRGSSIWLGCDEFGGAVLGRLAQWVDGPDRNPSIAQSSRLIQSRNDPEEKLPAGIEGVDGLPEMNAAAVVAVGDLLSGPHSRAVRELDGASPLVPHLWLCLDLQSPAAAGATESLARLSLDLQRRGIPVLLYLLLRDVTWGRDEAEDTAVKERIDAVLTGLIGKEAPGHGKTVAFVVSDFDAINGRYTADQVTEAAANFAEFVLVADAARAREASVERVFTPPRDLEIKLPARELHRVFAAVGAVVIDFPVKEQTAQIEAVRRTALVRALKEEAPPGWSPPAVPHLQRVSVPNAPDWQPLGLPEWRPQYWDPAVEAFQEVSRILRDWLSSAEDWRHAELTTCFEKRDALIAESGRALDDYRRALDADSRTILVSSDVRGLFSPIQRYLQRCGSDLEVSKADSGRVPIEAPAVGDADLTALVPQPEPLVDEVRRELAEMVEHRANPATVVFVAGVSAAIAFFWLFTIAQHFQESVVRWLIGLIPIGGSIAGSPRLREGLRSVQGWQLLEPAVAAFWIGVATVAYTAIVLLFVFLRERSRQETAFDRAQKRLRRWRDRAARDLPEALRLLQTWRYRENLDAAARSVDAAKDQLTSLQDALSAPEALPRREVKPFRVALPVPRPAAAELSEEQVDECVLRMRRDLAERGWSSATANEIETSLLKHAANIAEDREPDFWQELPTVVGQIEAARPGERGVLAKPRMGERSSEHWFFTEFLAGPERLIEDLRTSLAVSEVLPCPIEDRLFAVSVRSGLCAADLFR